jgi:hypothetical protein
MLDSDKKMNTEKVLFIFKCPIFSLRQKSFMFCEKKSHGIKIKTLFPFLETGGYFKTVQKNYTVSVIKLH